MTPTASTSTPTHYQTLGVSPKASRSEVKQAFVALARQYHPDRRERPGCSAPCDDCSTGNAPSLDGSLSQGETLSDSMTGSVDAEHFQRIQAAWDCLQDTQLRHEYDQTLYLQKHRRDAKRQSAIKIRIEECYYNRDTIVSGTPETENDQDGMPLHYKCRCGQELTVQDETDDLLDCTACSLVYDTSAVFIDDV